MLDEVEWAEVSAAITLSYQLVKARRASENVTVERVAVADYFTPVLDVYEKLTGFRESNHLAIMHHRISLFGPPCSACGKPLRSPQARWCAACWAPSLKVR